MIKLIAETAWHHEGDFSFMKNLVGSLCKESSVDVVKLHITLDLDEYMSKDHEAYDLLKSWLLTESQWDELINIVRDSGKELMLLLNDTKAIEFGACFNPEYIELHSICINVPALQSAVLKIIDEKTKIVIGIGGCTLDEVDAAVRAFEKKPLILMSGFQNFPTKYEDVNLDKIRKIQTLYAGKEFGYADHSAWNEENNELITMLVASNGMNYVEKHVTTNFGEKRCDYSAAISIDMLKNLSIKIGVLNMLKGDGAFKLNRGEQEYSQYGPMKMAPIANCIIKAGDILEEKHINFCRTSKTTDIGQVEIVEKIGEKLSTEVACGNVFKAADFL